MFGRFSQRAEAEPQLAPSADGNERPRDTATTANFVSWLAAHGETDRISTRRLRALYYEWCEFTESEPLTDGQLFRRREAAGIERHRESVGQRRWFYRVRFADVVALEDRRDGS
jgi:hypothetical protein